MDKNLNNLLKWSIEHTAPSTGPTAVTSTDNDTTSAPATTTPSNPAPSLDPAMLAALLGGPSDADLMKAAMEVITDETSSDLENKLIAFDNFEQLIESLDNANNLEPLALWTPLIELLSHSESELRRMAAWCVGTAVQNNARSQERLLAMGGIAPLVGLATAEAEEAAVRRKAIYALSSAVRNYQPAMDVAVEELKNKGQDHGKGDKVDAADMDAVDGVIGWLKQRVTDAKKE